MKLYKIRDKKTKLFSTGGMYPRWTKRGKVWKNIGHVKSHLTLWNNRYRSYDLGVIEFEIVEYEYTRTNERIIEL